jgi:hypothetical protein
MDSDGCRWMLRRPRKIRRSAIIFFGAVDADRVMFTYGRDIRLSAEQKGDPLNYFIYPYAEADGKPVKDLKTHFAFKGLSPPRAASPGN